MVGRARSIDEMMYICRQNNGEPGVDVQLVDGDFEDRVKALKDPSISAVSALTQSMMCGEQEGFKPLPYPEGIRWYGGGMCATDETILNNHDMVKDILRAGSVTDTKEHTDRERFPQLRMTDSCVTSTHYCQIVCVNQGSSLANV